jgi:hypothetical protein
MRNRPLAALAALALTGFGLSRPGSAQQPAENSAGGEGSPAPAPVADATPSGLHPFSFFLGAGAAKRKIYCAGCSQGVGFTALANLSRFLSPTTAIGIEGTGSFRSDGPASASLWSVMGAVTAWLTDQAPLFVSGGLGLVGYHETNATYEGSAGGTALGCGGRIGYDARLSQAVAVVPYIGYVSTIGHLQVGPASRVVSNLQFGLGLRLR